MSHLKSFKRIRKSFGKIESSFPIPNLIKIQKESYQNNFLQLDTPEFERKNSGLQGVFNSVFPIQVSSGESVLDFLSYSLNSPKHDIDECLQRGLSFVATLKINLRLTVWSVEEGDQKRQIKSIKDQEIHVGDIPFMTDNGTFIINGIQRVVVSQMHRSPGVFFYHDKGHVHSSGKFLYSARVIPYRGSWLDIEFDHKDSLYVRIDRKRKLPVTTLLMAMGMSEEDILDYYYDARECRYHAGKWHTEFNIKKLLPHTLAFDLVDAETGKVFLNAGKRITHRIAQKFVDSGLKEIVLTLDEMLNQYIGKEIVDTDTGEVIAKPGQQITEDLLAELDTSKYSSIHILDIPIQSSDAYIRNTLSLDKNKTQDSALIDILRIIRPGELGSTEVAKNLFNNLFFHENQYDLSEVGRVKINSRLDSNQKGNCLTYEDIRQVIRTLIKVKDGNQPVDDIEHLGNRRVRSVGELVENQFRIGLARMQKALQERMSTMDIDSAMPQDLVNTKVLISTMREFFNSSPLSQFMDQINPLSEISHKRRLSALGPGGVSRDHAGFDMRDVHQSHYGRICPIETPEGQNIGLINSIATYANVNKHGFIESPYRKVKNGCITNEVIYLTANEEDKYNIVAADVETIDGKIVDERVSCRSNGGNVVEVSKSEIDFIDVRPTQVVSIAASLIPFLENDDANRALMGSNMQRQAVPLIKTDAPLVGTGVENIIAQNSGFAITAKNDGIVIQADSKRIVISAHNPDQTFDVDIYNLIKYQNSNHGTCINYKSLVSIGQKVTKGQVISDGPSVDQGEIALGRNVCVAFLCWGGYNFEDAIIVSKKIVEEDVFTSIHIEEFEAVARDTRLGPEEITRDIPNVNEELLRHLDETGIICVGSKVNPGDILVGKVTPKSESPITPEEKLLKAIFGEKASDVKNSSLCLSAGVSGVVTEVRVLSRRGVDKDERAIAIEQEKINQYVKDKDYEINILSDLVYKRIREILDGHIIVDFPNANKKGVKLTPELLDSLPRNKYWEIAVEDESIMNQISEIKDHYDVKIDKLNTNFADRVEKIQSGDDLPQSVLKVVKVFIAKKVKLQPGDKMAGRHGNKGVVSIVVPEEDMPYTEDGTVVDMILNPLGVPSRMNVGQILETHLGWASKRMGIKVGNMINQYKKDNTQIDSIRDFVSKIYKNNEIENITDAMNDEDFINFCTSLENGVYVSTPVFDGAKIEDIKSSLELADQDTSGQIKLIDGRTGEYFERPVTVGYMYMIKLNHLVDNKIHARSVGSYSLVTQQPLGGKSHFGGQRLGEMEVWALQAYGATFVLQEMLTVKSDDVNGRIAMYTNIIKGNAKFTSGVPESFNVMVKEIRSLGLDIQLKDSKSGANMHDSL